MHISRVPVFGGAVRGFADARISRKPIGRREPRGTLEDKHQRYGKRRDSGKGFVERGSGLESGIIYPGEDLGITQ